MVHGKGLPHHPWYVNFLCILYLLLMMTLLILASSVAVKRVFSKGQLLMSHICNQLSAQSTQALLCVGAWTQAGYVKISDLKHVASLPDVKDDEAWPADEWIVA